MELGNALADVLFGDYNPGGRLIQTWPKSMEQLPPMMDYNIRHGRTYMYFKGEPLYPFGYGLSYTSFKYNDLRIDGGKLKANGEVNIIVSLENTGKCEGDEVVQLYVKHLDSKASRPLEELKAFNRVTLKPGEKKDIVLVLKAKDLAYWDEASKKFVVEADHIQLLVGSSSADIKLQKTLAVER